MSRRATFAGLVAVVLLALASPTIVWGQESGELHSDSYWVRMFVMNNGGRSQVINPYFKGNVCLGEFSQNVIASANYQTLSGFCPQSHWFLTGGILIAVMYPDLVIDNALAPPAPNPTSGAVRLGFAIREGDIGSLNIYDISGRMVRSLVSNAGGPTSDSIVWDLDDNEGRRVAAGIYFARLETGKTKVSRQIVLLGH
jgi:hypothetical protein